jgi:DNA-directed RNA polymerase
MSMRAETTATALPLHAKETVVAPHHPFGRPREPVLIKTTAAAHGLDHVPEQSECENLDWVELQQRISSDSGLYGDRHALGLERYLNAAELAEATRLGLPGTMRASDGYLHDEMDYLREFNVEERAVEQAVARYRAFTQNAMQRGDVSCLQPSQRLLLSWFYPVVMAIHEEQERIRRGELSTDGNACGPHLLRLKPEVLAVVALHETLGKVLQDKAGAPFSRVALAVGRSVLAEINLQRLREIYYDQRRQQLPQDRALRRTLTLAATGSGGSRAVSMINAAAKRMELDGATWDDRIALKVGSMLISFIMKHALVHVDAPSGKQVSQAFRHTYRFTHRGRRRIGMVELHNSVIDLLLANESDLRETILPRFQPMLVPPRPWTSYNCGGYLRSRNLVMRIRGSRLQLEALKKSDLSEVFAGLNALGATPWRINRPVLEVVEKLWQAGGDIAGLVARADLPVPQFADSIENPDIEGSASTIPGTYTVEQKRAIWRARKTNRERHALRCELQYRLETAREFAHLPRFYLPHNLDFRGRAYPMPTHLHHMSSDVSRGLLTFAGPGLPLGERGLFWLKVHLANLCGMDKLPFDERVAFAESVMPKVLSVAAAPTADSSLDWWARQEDPFQLLATCFELAASKGGRDPDYCCSLPVQQDGSCNGLQHYAALGRDERGAAQVNLLPSDRPQDVYSGVAALVRERIAEEARTGVPLAKLLEGHICRKLVKQTVMTSVYGVTLVGAREQIQNRLQELNGFPEDMLWQASYYLAKHTLGSLGDIFRGATDTMEWLAECAFRVATIRERTNAVCWMTPLGLPVIQPYRRRETRIVSTVVQHVLIEEHNDHLPVSRARQRSAFPPNFIHSLDSTHMLMTALACQRAGLQFAAVHDSFWTHAATIDEMNRLLRESFVRLHTRDLLQELREQFQLHFPEVELPPVPPKGTLDLSQVLLSPYFFD